MASVAFVACVRGDANTGGGARSERSTDAPSVATAVARLAPQGLAKTSPVATADVQPLGGASAAVAGTEAQRSRESSSAVRYPFGRTHSPLTRRVYIELQRVGATARRIEDRFIKVGDSITASGDYLGCLATDDVDLRQRPQLVETLDHFRKSGSFSRSSKAAEIGWSAWQPFAGSRAPLMEEVVNWRPRYALVMFGTNDVDTSTRSAFARRLTRIVDYLRASGVVPILWTIPDRRDQTKFAQRVVEFNAIIRGIAQSRAVPLVDYNFQLEPLPANGLTTDHVHPSTYRREGRRLPCDFGEVGLRYGYNQRNLLTLEALHRARLALAGALPLESEPRDSLGEAHLGSPLVVDALPFVDSYDLGRADLRTKGAADLRTKGAADLRTKGAADLRAKGAATTDTKRGREVAHASASGADADAELGVTPDCAASPSRVYRVNLPAATRLTFVSLLLDAQGTVVMTPLERQTSGAWKCGTSWGARQTVTLPAGSHHVAVSLSSGRAGSAASVVTLMLGGH